MYKLTYKNFSPMLQNYLEHLWHTRWNMLMGTQKFIPNKESDNSSNSRFIKDVTLGSFLIVPLPFQKSKWRFLETTKVSLKKKRNSGKNYKGTVYQFSINSILTISTRSFQHWTLFDVYLKSQIFFVKYFSI